MLNENVKLYQGDCLEVMDNLIEQGIKVDAIITDPPYGTTACKWDSVIPFDEMWDRLKRLIKDNGAIALFGSEPFSSLLRVSNLNNFKYCKNELKLFKKYSISNKELQVFFFRFFKLNLFFLLFSILKYPFLL